MNTPNSAPPKYEEAVGGQPSAPMLPDQYAPGFNYQQQAGTNPAGTYQQGPYPNQPYQQPNMPYQQSPYQQTAQPTGYPAATTVVAGPALIVSGTSLGRVPATLQCRFCQQHVTTTVSHSPGGLAWLIAALICVFGGWLFCFLIPFCIPDLQDVTHTCPNCKRCLGMYRPL